MQTADALALMHESLRREIRDSGADEARFQKWFESNANVFRVLGYQRHLAQPKLRLTDGKFLVPDFMVQDFSGTWRIFELKRADTVVLKRPDRRQDFRAEFSSYIQQCREYADWFLQDVHREWFFSEHGVQVQKSVPSVIVASVDDDTDVGAVHELLVDRGNLVALQTYSSVLRSIARQIDVLTADVQSLPGVSLTMLGSFSLNPKFDEQVVLDLGCLDDRSRISLMVIRRKFVLRVWDESRSMHELAAHQPLVSTSSAGRDLTLVEAEVGVGSRHLVMSMYVDGRCVARRIADAVELDASQLRHRVIGSDIRGRSNADFCLAELIVYLRSLTWAERLQVRSRIGEVYGYYLSPLIFESPAMLEFKGNKFLGTRGHPTCPGVEAGPEAPSRSTGASLQGPASWYSVSSAVLASGEVVPADPNLRDSAIRLPGL